MLRSGVLILLALTACDAGEDDRPLTLQSVTQNVLVPSCGQTECHSTMTQQDGYAFDTVTVARLSMISSTGPGILVDSTITDPTESALIGFVTGAITPRMPEDKPILDRDLTLLKAWVAAGVPGAQCIPGQPWCLSNGDTHLYACDDDGNLGAATQDCATSASTCNSSPTAHCQVEPGN